VEEVTEYQTITTHVPPNLRVVDGVLYVEVIFGAETYRAPVGDGRQFFSQVAAKLVDPALLATQQIKDAAALASYPTGSTGVGGFKPDVGDRRFALLEDEPLVGDGAAFRAFISPND